MAGRRIMARVLVLSVGLAALGALRQDAWTQVARYRFEYRVDFSKVHLDPTAAVRLWLPYPAESAAQHVLSAAIDASWPHTLHHDALGNQIVYLEGRGIPDRPVTMRFVIERRPSVGVPLAAIVANTPSDPQRYVHADTLIPLDGVIRDLAVQASQGRRRDAEKVRAFYDYVVKTMRYNKEGTGWGRGDAIWACTNKRGNCTDFHSLFIGMAGSQGIPARFLIGFPISADDSDGAIPGYHCWAEFFDKARGWVPIDASEANKNDAADAYFGKLPNDRIQFSSGRDLVLAPPQHGAPLNYFIYPYAEADGTPVKNLGATFRFERVAAGGSTS